jgi:molybdopterin converting factor small subunit
MNKITIRVTAPLRKFTGGRDDITLDAASVGDALSALCKTYPDLNGRILSADGSLRDFINVFIGKKNIRALEGLSTPTVSGDVLSIASPFSGG